ncbi:MAG TPA: hypothetical protein DEB42_06845 [Jeotgalicoccus sp.]|nr:hypothetical protein [Jeotgalicoccus sp.]
MLTQISPHVYILPFDSQRDRPNLGYIHGEKFSILVDAGNSKAHLNAMLEAVYAAGLPKPEIALITHWHWDHTFGMHAFPGTTMTQTKTNEILSILTKWEWTPEAMDERFKTGEECEFCDTHMKIEYDDITDIKVVRADIEFDGNLTLNLGSVTVEVTPIANPHSDDGAVVFVQEDKVLFAGDADTGDFYKLDGGYDADKFYDYVTTVDKIPYDTYIHGHLAPMTRTEVSALRKEIGETDL